MIRFAQGDSLSPNTDQRFNNRTTSTSSSTSNRTGTSTSSTTSGSSNRTGTSTSTTSGSTRNRTGTSTSIDTKTASTTTPKTIKSPPIAAKRFPLNLTAMAPTFDLGSPENATLCEEHPATPYCWWIHCRNKSEVSWRKIFLLWE